MSKLFVVPIEPLEERYSAQWASWFQKELSNRPIPFEFIEGEPLGDTIEHGAFLDVVGTNAYKASQLRKICQMIHDGRIKNKDVLLFHDLWFPGLEMLFYIRDGLNMDLRIYGCLHAGTYDPHDFLTKQGMERWALNSELSWFNEVDGIFLATKFHQSLLTRRRYCRNTHVTGFPLYTDNLESQSHLQREPVIVFPHRLDEEKQPTVFETVMQSLRPQLPKQWRWVYTKNVCLTKGQYYALLGTAAIAVSCAVQETWGIAMQEAWFSGCIPLVPNRLSYPEMYPSDMRYDTLTELKKKILRIVTAYETDNHRYQRFLMHGMDKLKKAGEQAIPNMLKEIYPDGRI